MSIVGKTTNCGKLIDKLTKSSERRVKVKCNTCGITTNTTYHNYRLNQDKIGWTDITYCRKCACIKNGIERRGKFTSWNKGKFLDPEKRIRNPWISSDGYRMIYDPSLVSKEDVSKWKHYRKEHLLIMEKHLGRSLKKSERIHHIDGDKLNNSIDNLFLCSSEQLHRQVHSKINKLFFELVRMNRFIFNNETGEYEFK